MEGFNKAGWWLDLPTCMRTYKQTTRQTLVQMVERMEAQCREKRATIAALRSGIEGGRAAAAGASAGLVVALTALVQQGDVMG